jgi:hypothetical protein
MCMRFVTQALSSEGTVLVKFTLSALCTCAVASVYWQLAGSLAYELPAVCGCIVAACGTEHIR